MFLGCLTFALTVRLGGCSVWVKNGYHWVNVCYPYGPPHSWSFKFIQTNSPPGFVLCPEAWSVYSHQSQHVGGMKALPRTTCWAYRLHEISPAGRGNSRRLQIGLRHLFALGRSHVVPASVPLRLFIPTNVCKHDAMLSFAQMQVKTVCWF